MAFNNIMQLATAKISKHLNPNPTVVEWGNQRFRYSKDWIDKCSQTAEKTIRHPVEYVWEYFEDLGFSNYLAIDINTELRSIAMDLNFILKDKYNYTEQFDLVTNNGTGEHIFDQRTVFENMHNLCKVGGIMLCVLPFAPWINHGFYNYHPALFRDIAAANGYEWGLFWLAQNTGKYVEMPISMNSWGYYEQKKPRLPLSDLESAYDELHNRDGKAQNISIVTAYRKTNEYNFQIPMQGRYVNDVVDELKTEYSDTNVDLRQQNHTSANY
jgi:SAM-dependent methyltransferase